MYFDSHAHFDDKKYDDDRHELLKEMFDNNVDYIINAGSDIRSSLFGIKLANQYANLFAAVGVHPHEVENMTNKDMESLREFVKEEKVVAIGEIGLDYYYDFSPRDKQRFWFKEQLALAKELDMPVIIHSRDAAQEVFDIIEKSGVRKGVIHSYSGSYQMALDYINMGFYIGIGGVVTFNNAKKVVETVEKIPIQRILTETDSPYLSPVPVRGTRNNSQNIKYICEKIGEIKQISPDMVAEIASENAKDLFF